MKLAFRMRICNANLIEFRRKFACFSHAAFRSVFLADKALLYMRARGSLVAVVAACTGHPTLRELDLSYSRVISPAVGAALAALVAAEGPTLSALQTIIEY
jgi:hypothetical protein